MSKSNLSSVHNFFGTNVIVTFHLPECEISIEDRNGSMQPGTLERFLLSRGITPTAVSTGFNTQFCDISHREIQTLLLDFVQNEIPNDL